MRGDGISRMYFEALSKKYHFSLRDPVEKLSKEVMDVILYGTKGEKLELQYDQLMQDSNSSRTPSLCVSL